MPIDKRSPLKYEPEKFELLAKLQTRVSNYNAKNQIAEDNEKFLGAKQMNEPKAQKALRLYSYDSQIGSIGINCLKNSIELEKRRVVDKSR